MANTETPRWRNWHGPNLARLIVALGIALVILMATADTLPPAPYSTLLLLAVATALILLL
jgi:hypothetical protein